MSRVRLKCPLQILHNVGVCSFSFGWHGKNVWVLNGRWANEMILMIPILLCFTLCISSFKNFSMYAFFGTYILRDFGLRFHCNFLKQILMVIGFSEFWRLAFKYNFEYVYVLLNIEWDVLWNWFWKDWSLLILQLYRLSLARITCLSSNYENLSKNYRLLTIFCNCRYIQLKLIMYIHIVYNMSNRIYLIVLQ